MKLIAIILAAVLGFSACHKETANELETPKKEIKMKTELASLVSTKLFI